LTDSLVSRDYLFARVERVRIDRSQPRPQIEIDLDEGPPAWLGRVFWNGDSLLVPDDLVRRMTCIPGARFHWPDVELDTDLLLTYFENSGYPFAKVDIKSIQADSAAGTVDLRLVISAGPQTAIDFVAFPGNKQTREDLLQAESGLRLHRPYDHRRVVAAKRRLNRLDFISRVGNGELAVNGDGKTGVRFPITEARSTRLDIAAGYLPATATSKAALSGLVNVEFLNLFGGGRRARIHWERPSSRIQAVDLAYREPWVFRLPIAVRLDFGQRIEDTLYVTRKFGARIEVELASSLMGWSSIQQEAILADSQSSAQLNLPNTSTTYAEAGLAYDTRDHPTNPRSGVYFASQAGTGWRHRERSESGIRAGAFRHHRVGIDLEAVQEIIPFWIGDFSIHARGLSTTEPEVLLPDLYRLGGARTVRGYREEQFLGSRVGWASGELRYWLGTASRAFVFGDAGSVFREQAGKSATRFMTGVGFGIRLETNLGIWGVDYGIGEGDRILNGKLHISLLSSF
jgi:outer membrane protein insertion porin family